MSNYDQRSSRLPGCLPGGVCLLGEDVHLLPVDRQTPVKNITFPQLLLRLLGNLILETLIYHELYMLLQSRKYTRGFLVEKEQKF